MEFICDFYEQLTGMAIYSDDSLFIAKTFGGESTASIQRVLIFEGKAVKITESQTSGSALGLAFDNHGDLFFGDHGKIMKMSKEGKVSNFVGSGESGNKDGEGVNAKLSTPVGICFDESGFAYFCDSSNHSIRKVTPEGKVTTVCGSSEALSGFQDGKEKEVLFNLPWGIVYNKLTKIFYITDSKNKKIRTMTLDGTVGTLCEFSSELHSMAIDEGGNLYVSTKLEGIITVNPKGEIKRIPNTTIFRYSTCFGMAFNSKEDLCVTMTAPYSSEKAQLLVIRKTQLLSFWQSTSSPVSPVVTDIRRNSEKVEIDELTKWLHDMQLQEIEPILRGELGVSNLRLLMTIEESDLNGLQIKPIPKKQLLQDIQKLKNSNSNT